MFKMQNISFIELVSFYRMAIHGSAHENHVVQKSLYHLGDRYSCIPVILFKEGGFTGCGPIRSSRLNVSPRSPAR